ncbi:polysaccharide biosynthesis/export family protein [Prochlorococcus marinus]|uniref:Polysaccharide export protein n=1 Tax=Prochlorococcus marinus XMU1408 TaxID=2213228 RepID=A0A318R499_PROMR|nr:polysaccharide biosynthesis/export family protein [Prochlorococcus marinus]MBW3041842.1 hypothetical protein [Prochlorococcus marinus str. XMU1408]PYE02980.1 hypothetical protein DNJ73_04325 [Prochlorococcus marinus XMU1408]
MTRIKYKSLKYIYIALFFLATTGSNIYNKLYSKELENNNLPSNVLSTDYFYQKQDSNYILGPGDNIKIEVSEDIIALTAVKNIDSDGNVKLSRLNTIYISGLTISELEKLLNIRYREYVKNPNVKIELVKPRPVKVYIDGEIVRPGYYTLNTKILNSEIIKNERAEVNINDLEDINQENFYNPNLYDALKAASGILATSDLSNIKVIRKNSISNGGGFITANINFMKLITSNQLDKNIRLYDGDIIKIKKSKTINTDLILKINKTNINSKFINVFVNGKVDEPGIVKLPRVSTLNDAIQMAGGRQISAGSVRFYRYENNGVITNLNIKYNLKNKPNSVHNPYMREGDMIYIGKNKLSTFSELTSEITRPFVGVYSFLNLFKDGF